MAIQNISLDLFLSTHQMSQLGDDEIISYTKQVWNIPKDEPLQVIGRLGTLPANNGKLLFRLYDISTIDGIQVEYPLNDLEINKTIKRSGIFIPNVHDAEIKKLAKSGIVQYIRCVLQLSSDVDRKKYNNPCLLNVNPNEIYLVKRLEPQIFRNFESEPVVNKALLDYIAENNKQELLKILKDTEDQIAFKQNELNEIDSHIEKQQKKHENLSMEHINQINLLKEQIAKSQKEISEAEIKQNQLETQLQLLHEEIHQGEEIMGKKLEKFRSFIREKADKLLQLELLDIEEYNEIMMLKEGKEEENESLHFITDLNGNFSSAVKHIQAYLFNKDIIYPRYVLEDFFALIKTNDLIILAGDSGSGKTNLVKSFAEAVSGKSVIIPVKPNWTSSEDLLGYYNPLEKKYLATPFLEAILEASHNLDTPYFICLDEMNLARVEYYFADFLSLLEERNSLPEIKLYSEDESAHVLSEFKHVISLIDAAKEKYQKNHLVNFMELLQDQEVNRELKNVFGLNEKDSLIKYHSDLRRMLHGIINTPSSITFPPNVRIIGTVNIDETTHYLAPKILDRAHVMKFDSPLLYDWESISAEIETSFDDSLPLNVGVDDLGVRSHYPSFDKDGDFEKIVMNLNRTFFNKLGIEVGLRTIRQALNYKDVFNQVIGDLDLDLVINNFVLHKILPKITFDGNTKIEGKEKIELLKEMLDSLNETCENVGSKGRKSCIELESMILKAKENDGIVNYWA